MRSLAPRPGRGSGAVSAALSASFGRLCHNPFYTGVRPWKAGRPAPAAVSDAYDQPVRFGLLGKISDFFGRMPEVVVVDLRDDEPELTWAYRGSSTFDRPDLEKVLSVLPGLRTHG